METLVDGKHYTTDQITRLSGQERWPFEHYTHPEWLQYDKHIQSQHQVYVLPNKQHITHTNTWHSQWKVYNNTNKL